MILEEAKKRNLISTLTDEYIQSVKDSETNTNLEDIPDDNLSSISSPNGLTGGNSNE